MSCLTSGWSAFWERFLQAKQLVRGCVEGERSLTTRGMTGTIFSRGGN